jgi:hypothetical protein
MEGQREKSSSRRRQRRKAKAPRNKVAVEPVLIAARRPDSPLLKNGFHTAVASAQPKHAGHAVANGHAQDAAEDAGSAHSGNGHSSNGHAGNGHSSNGQSGNGHSVTNARFGDAHLADADALLDGDVDALGGADQAAGTDGADRSASSEAPRGDVVRRRAVRIVKAADNVLGMNNREQQLLDRLMRSQGRGAISRAADDLWESKFVAPRQQEIQIQLLEHENEHRARDAVFIMAELLQREAPIKRPVLDQRLRRLEQSAEDPITRDAAGALRRSMRVHHGM